MGNNILTRVKDFNDNLINANYDAESTSLKSIIKENYLKEILNFIEIIKKMVNESKDVIITVDSDFDGYSCAREVYHFVRAFGVGDERIRLIPLSSLHTSDRIEGNNSVLIVTDTSYGHVKARLGEKSHIIWIDHHEIKTMDFFKARSYVEDGIFINSSRDSNDQIKHLSCGAFVFLFLNSVLEILDITEDNRIGLQNSFSGLVQQDALLSLISDVMDIGKFPGLIKGIYDSRKTQLFEALKNNFDYNNKKYFKKYIAQINNIIRMERFDMLEQILKEQISFNLISEMERLDKDKKELLHLYFRPCLPINEALHKQDDVEICIYQLPLASNRVIRNFKGLLASIKIPEGKTFAIFSYYKADSTVYASCRNNISIDLQKYIREGDVKLTKMGGHPGAFGMEMPENEFPKFTKRIEGLKCQKLEKVHDDNVLDFLETNRQFKHLSAIALYNEFNKEEVRLKFSKGYFKEITQEPKRTVYSTILAEMGRRVDVVSFAVNTVKEELVVKPVLKKSLYDLDCIEIGEF